MKFSAVTKQAAADAIGITRMQLHRLRTGDDWPGDETEWEDLMEWMRATLDPSGRGAEKRTYSTPGEPRKKPTRAKIEKKSNKAVKKRAPAKTKAKGKVTVKKIPTKPTPQQVVNLQYKRSQIERNKATLAKYQRNCLERYREELGQNMNVVMDVFFDVIKGLGLDEDQVGKVREKLRASVAGVMAEAEKRADEWSFD